MDWKGKRVLIIGAARQGTATASYLVNQGADVTLNDQLPSEALEEVKQTLKDQRIRWALGGHPLSLLEGVDLVFPSGGVPLEMPLIVEAVNRGIQLSNDSQIFLEEAPCKVIGITGSAGKTTTTTLVAEIARAANIAHSHNGVGKIWMGGNIGTPLIERLDEMASEDIAVMELSSFQLELMRRSPQVAVILNVTPNHLDRHGTMEAYTAAKARILDNQTDTDIAILGRDDEGALALRERVAGRLYTFGLKELERDQLGTFVRSDWIWVRGENGETEVMPVENIQLLGEHNLQNVLAACAISAAIDVPTNAMRTAVENFDGVEHRLEFVRRWGGVDWYNDSIATAPERAIAAMKAFDAPLALLAGGRDKSLPWEDFAAEVKERVHHLIAFGEAADLVIDAVGQAGSGEKPYSITRCDGLSQAVAAAAEVVEAEDVVLLSPGGTSYDEFIDFEERGEKFKGWVRAL